MTPDSQLPPSADPTWFRPPTRREHVLGSALFTAFGLFFLAFAFFQRPSWIFWPLLLIAVLSFSRAVNHIRSALTPRPPNQQGGTTDA